jgi:predicted MFS family arabinose efflux permease
MTSKTFSKWSTVFAGLVGSAANISVVASYVFGLFIKAISAEYGWLRSEITVAITCFYIFAGLGSLCLGVIISRWSIRWPSIIFVAIAAAALGSIALLPRSVLLLSIVFSITGFFGSAANSMPYAVAIARWFDRNRGLALAIAVSGTGISSIFMSRYANWLLEHYGWRGGYVGVALFVASFGLTALLLLFRDPPPDTRRVELPLTLRQLYTGDRVFWLIAGPIFLISVALLGLVTNVAPILTDRSMTLREVATLMGLLGISTWATRLGLGLLLDRIHVRIISGAIFLLVALGALLLTIDSHGWLLPAIAAVLIGCGMGAEADILTYTVSRYFGPRALGKAVGAVWILWAWGGALGVTIGSAAYDLFGSYVVALVFFSVVAVTAAVIIFQLGAYRFGELEEIVDDAATLEGAVARIATPESTMLQ